VGECKPLGTGHCRGASLAIDLRVDAGGRGSHSSTFQLNLSALYGIRGARRGCGARVKGVLGGAGRFCVSDTAQVELKSERV